MTHSQLMTPLVVIEAPSGYGKTSLLTHSGLSAYGAITAFGLVVAGTMLLIGLWHRRNVRQYPDEVARLLEIARSDGHHHHH